MTAAEYFIILDGVGEPGGSWRRGQFAFNLLACVNKPLAERVRGTAIDPFCRDGLLEDFRQFVRREWTEDL